MQFFCSCPWQCIPKHCTKDCCLYFLYWAKIVIHLLKEQVSISLEVHCTVLMLLCLITWYKCLKVASVVWMEFKRRREKTLLFCALVKKGILFFLCPALQLQRVVLFVEMKYEYTSYVHYVQGRLQTGLPFIFLIHMVVCRASIQQDCSTFVLHYCITCLFSLCDLSKSIL